MKLFISFSRFIGELFKLHVLTSNIMHDCIQKLIGEKDEDSIECLCRLLTTIGKDLDKPGKQGQPVRIIFLVEPL